MRREEKSRLEREAPTHFEAPTGTALPIDYEAEQGPTIAVRLQELFGLNVHPSIAQGKIPLVLALLWAWVGWAFLWQRYAQINWAAQHMAVAWWLQAVLLAAAAWAPLAPRPPRPAHVLGLALAAAGEIPNDMRKVDALTPYAIPSDPSIICAINPPKTKRKNSGPMLLQTSLPWSLISSKKKKLTVRIMMETRV